MKKNTMLPWIIFAIIVIGFVVFAHLNGWRVAGDGTPFRPQKMLWQNRVEQGGFNPPKPLEAPPAEIGDQSSGNSDLKK